MMDAPREVMSRWEADDQVLTGQEGLMLYNTTGFSMWPFIRQGDKLIIKKIPLDGFSPGDIVLYNSGSILVCHRLIQKTMDKGRIRFYIRGDTSFDGEYVDGGDILGKGVGIIKNGKAFDLSGRRRGLVNWLIAVMAPWMVLGIRGGMWFRNRILGMINRLYKINKEESGHAR